MYSTIKLFGHPIHPMLVAFPIALYTSTLVAFLAYARTGDLFWLRVGIAANVAGVAMAILAALPGFLDWLIGIPADTPARSTGLTHMILNVLALSVFAVNAWLHFGYWNDQFGPSATTGIILSLAGIGIMLAAGWMGWNLVQKHHVGIELLPEQAQAEPTDWHAAA